MRHRISLMLAAFALAAVATTATAQTVVTPADPQGWGAYTYGSSSPEPYGAMTSAYPHLGNGSAEIRLYDQGTSSVQWWYQPTSTTPLASLNQLSFDWYVSSISTTPLWTTPAFGMYIVNSNIGNAYLIWEGAYNGTIGGAPQDTWISSNILGDNFWWDGSDGTGVCGRAASYNTLDWFMTQCLGGDAEVFGFSPFLGNGYAGAEFAGAFDNVAYGFVGGAAERFNFEASATSTVPEPATMTLLATGLAGMVAARRRRKAV